MSIVTVLEALFGPMVAPDKCQMASHYVCFVRSRVRSHRSPQHIHCHPLIRYYEKPEVLLYFQINRNGL